MKMNILKIAALGGALMLMAGGASAATLSCTTSGNGNSGATFSLGNADAVACFSGNDNASFDFFGDVATAGSWTLSDKTDNGGSGPLTFTTGPINDDKSGGWAVSDNPSDQQLAIILKAGNGFAAFLIPDDETSGDWSSSKDLSHASLYYRGNGDGGGVGEVPLPAALPLFATALAGFGFVSRRRRG